MKRIVVTGGAGFIGSHIVDALVYRERCAAKIVDNFSSGRIENIERHLNTSSVSVLRGDLKDPRVADEAIRDSDAVFHFAANPEVRVSSVSPEVHFNENILTTFNVLEAMRRMDVVEIVFASSS
ncbi:MAG: GDP-mannose 4,6-dehydratase, partial [Sulfolobales archaeon]|nr:GDP-mannose 4,6-dehydratase [Sulfolobales archaeon]